MNPVFRGIALIGLCGCGKSAPGFASSGLGSGGAATAVRPTTGMRASTGVAGAAGAHSETGSSAGADTREDDSPLEPGALFDVGAQVGEEDEDTCEDFEPVACDGLDDNPWHAIGLNCEGGPSVDGRLFGDPRQLHVHEGNFGTYEPPAFAPREGEKMVILSTGIASAWLSSSGALITTDLGGEHGSDLPAPMTREPVSDPGGTTCTDDPSLVGMGECSNTVESQVEQGEAIYDLAYLTFSAQVPRGTYGLSYDFAFMSVEYPGFYQNAYNDMFVAWLESERWTGNISFDAFGAPISLNASFLDYKDAPNPYDCAEPCVAPQLQGTAAEGHAGTRWLTTTAPVTPGETVELFFAIFDLSDPDLDSGVLLDNFRWSCEGGPPTTVPS